MRVLVYVGLLAMGVALVFWLAQRRSDARRVLSAPPVSAPIHHVSTARAGESERARLLYGPEAGPGELRLTSSQLIFSADSGRVWIAERIDISGVSATRDLPDRTVARAALVVIVDSEVHYFEVDEPLDWISRLQ